MAAWDARDTALWTLRCEVCRRWRTADLIHGIKRRVVFGDCGPGVIERMVLCCADKLECLDAAATGPITGVVIVNSGARFVELLPPKQGDA